MQNFSSARQNLDQIRNGERSLDLPAAFPNLCHIPIMKGRLSPAVLERKHHLEQSDVAALYAIMHLFSFGFHDKIEEMVGGATHGLELKHAIWLGLAELWQAGLCVHFHSDVIALTAERDKAVKVAESAAAECRSMQIIHSGLTEQCAPLDIEACTLPFVASVVHHVKCAGRTSWSAKQRSA